MALNRDDLKQIISIDWDLAAFARDIRVVTDMTKKEMADIGASTAAQVDATLRRMVEAETQAKNLLKHVFREELDQVKASLKERTNEESLAVKAINEERKASSAAIIVDAEKLTAAITGQFQLQVSASKRASDAIEAANAISMARRKAGAASLTSSLKAYDAATIADARAAASEKAASDRHYATISKHIARDRLAQQKALAAQEVALAKLLSSTKIEEERRLTNDKKFHDLIRLNRYKAALAAEVAAAKQAAIDKAKADKAAVPTGSSIMAGIRSATVGQGLRASAAIAGATGNWKTAASFYAIERLGSAAGVTNVAISSLGGTMAATIATAAAFTAGAALLAAGFGALMKHGNELDNTLADMSTLMDNNGRSVSDYASAINGLAGEASKLSIHFNRDIVDVVKGFKSAFSAGVDEKDVVEFTTIVGNLATATNISFEAATETLTSFRDSYGLTLDELKGVGDKIFRTIDISLIKADQFGQSLGRLIPIAAGAGISVDDMFATLTAISRGGQTTSQSVTALSAAIHGLVDPTDEAKDQFRDWGIGVKAVDVEAKGLLGILKELAVVTNNGQLEEVTKVFSEQRAARGISSVLQKMELVEDSLARIKAAPLEDAAAVAAAKVLDTFSQNLSKIITAVSNVAQLIGTDLLDAANKIFFGDAVLSDSSMASFTNGLEAIGEVIKTLGIGLMGLGEILFHVAAAMIDIVTMDWDGAVGNINKVRLAAVNTLDSIATSHRNSYDRMQADVSNYAEAVKKHALLVAKSQSMFGMIKGSLSYAGAGNAMSGKSYNSDAINASQDELDRLQGKLEEARARKEAAAEAVAAKRYNEQTINRFKAMNVALPEGNIKDFGKVPQIYKDFFAASELELQRAAEDHNKIVADMLSYSISTLDTGPSTDDLAAAKAAAYKHWEMLLAAREIGMKAAMDNAGGVKAANPISDTISTITNFSAKMWDGFSKGLADADKERHAKAKTLASQYASEVEKLYKEDEAAYKKAEDAKFKEKERIEKAKLKLSEATADKVQKLEDASLDIVTKIADKIFDIQNDGLSERQKGRNARKERSNIKGRLDDYTKGGGSDIGKVDAMLSRYLELFDTERGSSRNKKSSKWQDELSALMGYIKNTTKGFASNINNDGLNDIRKLGNGNLPSGVHRNPAELARQAIANVDFENAQKKVIEQKIVDITMKIDIVDNKTAGDIALAVQRMIVQTEDKGNTDLMKAPRGDADPAKVPDSVADRNYRRDQRERRRNGG